MLPMQMVGFSMWASWGHMGAYGSVKEGQLRGKLKMMSDTPGHIKVLSTSELNR